MPATEVKGLTITRIFNTPRETLWRAWTEADLMKKWWGPVGFTAPVVNIDLRPGGKYLVCMRSPDGKDFWSTGTYHEIIKPEKLVMTDSFADERGNVVPATFYGMSPGFPLETTVTVLFEKQGHDTKFTLKYASLGGISAEDLSNMQQGWNQSFDKLAELLKTEKL